MPIVYVLMRPGDVLFWHGGTSREQTHQVIGERGTWSVRVVTTWDTEGEGAATAVEDVPTVVEWMC